MVIILACSICFGDSSQKSTIGSWSVGVSWNVRWCVHRRSNGKRAHLLFPCFLLDVGLGVSRAHWKVLLLLVNGIVHGKGGVGVEGLRYKLLVLAINGLLDAIVAFLLIVFAALEAATAKGRDDVDGVIGAGNQQRPQPEERCHNQQPDT